ncbi:hypothetical protein [Nioella sp.]|uniref:hypothetical protein n=1 Tax=Nioella sp. TaxID=1912091 RepID=UPI003B515ECD
MQLTDMEAYTFSIFVHAYCDATLLIRDASGQWLFSDNVPGTLEPHVEMTRGIEGRVDFWAGSASGDSCRQYFRLLTMTGPGEATEEEIADMVEGDWTMVIGGFRTDLSFSRSAEGHWSGLVHLMGEDTALDNIIVDGATGRVQFTSTADGALCYGLLSGDYLDGGCVDPEHADLFVFEAYR